MRKPLIVITGVDPMAMQATMSSLVWDLPKVVAIRHTIEPITQKLSRFVSSVEGSVESAEIDLEHACVGCAIREDILPTIVRLAQDPQWETVVACLPTSAEADHLSAAISRDPLVSRYIRLSSVIATVPGEEALEHLMNSQWLGEFGYQTGPGDPRCVGESACAQVEYADVVVATMRISDTGRDFIHALKRPTAQLVVGAENIEVASLTEGRHLSGVASAWRSPMADYELPDLPRSDAWRLDLQSSRPFHPERLVDHIGRLDGPFRSRGCFWVPTRPDLANTWDGVCGQVGIGQHSHWGSQTPITRLILTGVGRPPAGLHDIFDDLLLTDQEMNLDVGHWQLAEDGLEPWLGDIPHAA